MGFGLSRQNLCLVQSVSLVNPTSSLEPGTAGFFFWNGCKESMKTFTKFPLLLLAAGLSFIMLLLSWILLSQDSISVLISTEIEEPYILSSHNITDDFQETSSQNQNEETVFSEKISLSEFTQFPFFTRGIELFENLKGNIFRPDADPENINKAKYFHETLEYLEGKQSLLGLSPLEKEELVILQLRKKKDLREVLNNTYEKFKEELSAEQKREFSIELQSLDDSIRKLSQEFPKK